MYRMSNLNTRRITEVRHVRSGEQMCPGYNDMKNEIAKLEKMRSHITADIVDDQDSKTDDCINGSALCLEPISLDHD